MSNNIVVIAEARDGNLKKPSLEAISGGLELAGKSGGQVIAVVIGSGIDSAKSELASSGADKVVAIEGDSVANYSGDGYCRAAVEAIGSLDACCILRANTAMGKDLAPRIAAALGAGLVSDATALHFEDGTPGATKPARNRTLCVRSVAHPA